MSCRIKYKENGYVDKVLSPNGRESKLYLEGLKEFNGNQKMALDNWAKAYTPAFKLAMGDFESNPLLYKGELDSNNEPVFQDVFKIDLTTQEKEVQEFLEDLHKQPDEKSQRDVTNPFREQHVFLTRKVNELRKQLAGLKEDSQEYKDLKRDIKKLDNQVKLAAEQKSEVIYNVLGEEMLQYASDYVEDLKDGRVPADDKKIMDTWDIVEAWKEFRLLSSAALGVRDRLFPFVENLGINKIREHYTGNGDKITKATIDNQDKDIDSLTLGTGYLGNLQNHIARTEASIIKERQNKVSRINKKFTDEVITEVKLISEYASKNNLSLQEVYDKLIKNKNFTIQLISPYDDLMQKNEEFDKIMAVPELKRFYEFYQRVLMSVRGKVPSIGENITLEFIPNIHKDNILNILKDLSPVKTRALDNKFNEELLSDIVPLKYHKKLNADEKSRDLGNAILEFASWANNYNEMADILPEVRLLQNLLAYKLDEKSGVVKDRVFRKHSNPSDYINGKDSNLWKMMDATITMQVKGKLKKDEAKPSLWNTEYNKDGEPVAEKYLDLKGVADDLLKWNSLLRIGLSPITAGANLLFGDTTNVIEAIGGRFFNLKQLHQASKIFFNNTRFNGFKEDSVVVKWLEKLNPLQELDDYENLLKVKIGKRMTKEKLFEYMYSLQKKGELWIQTRTMLAMMIHDGYLNSDGTETDKGKKITEKESDRFSEKIQALNGRIHGRYSQREAATLYQSVWYRIFSQFRKWLPAAVESRFGAYVEYDNRLQTDFEGRYRTLGRKVLKEFKNPLLAFENLLLPLINQKAALERGNLTPLEIYNMRKNLTEITLLLASAIGFMLLHGGDDEKDKKMRREPWLKASMTLLNRVSGDISFFYSTEGWTQLLKNSAPMSRLIVDLSYIASHPQYIFYTGDYEYVRGSYKGENKIYSRFRRITPISKSISDIRRILRPDTYLEELR